MAKTGNYQIPFNKDGDQLHYPDRWQNAEMRDNFEFEDTLTFETYERGRSAAYFIFKRSTGEKVTFFMTDFCGIVNHMRNGKVSGNFTFTKRGMNYGTKMLTVTFHYA